jgi:hypothetical protein
MEIHPKPNFLWKITIGGDLGIVMRFTSQPPNWLQVFMYKLLLGWEVSTLEGNDEEAQCV